MRLNKINRARQATWFRKTMMRPRKRGNKQMSKNYVQTMGYGGPSPLAVIFWREPGKDEASYKTVCYDEQDVINMYKRHITDGDFYNKLVPSVQMVNEKEPVQRVA